MNRDDIPTWPKSPMGFPNAVRSLAYELITSIHLLAIPAFTEVENEKERQRKWEVVKEK